MIKRTCLLIDDEKQDDNIPIIISEGEKYNIEIEVYQFNVGNQERRDLLENEEISLEKVGQVFRSEFRHVKFDLIAIDWNIGSGIKGPTLIQYFNESGIRKNVPKILYSGALREEVEKLFDDYRQNTSMTFKSIWGQLRTLLTTNALAYAGKENYELELVQQLRKIDDSVESTIEQELRANNDYIFKLGFPNKQFKGKSFGEIADIIDNDPNLRSNFTKEITQQVIAYLTERI